MSLRVMPQVLCILLWQFSAFAFLLQVSAAFLCTLLACHDAARKAMDELLTSHLVALLLAGLLLFGNELLVQHLLVTQCVAIKCLESPHFSSFFIIFHPFGLCKCSGWCCTCAPRRSGGYSSGSTGLWQCLEVNEKLHAAARCCCSSSCGCSRCPLPLRTSTFGSSTRPLEVKSRHEPQEQDADLVPLLPHCGVHGTHLQHQELVSFSSRFHRFRAV